MEQARLTAEAMGIQWEALEPEKTDEQSPVELPPGFDFVWEVFIALCSTRSSGMAANPITWGEVESWSRLHRITLLKHELHVLKLLDAKWLKIIGTPDSKDR